MKDLVSRIIIVGITHQEDRTHFGSMIKQRLIAMFHRDHSDIFSTKQIMGFKVQID